MNENQEKPSEVGQVPETVEQLQGDARSTTQSHHGGGAQVPETVEQMQGAQVPETVEQLQGAFAIPNDDFVVPDSHFVDAVKLLGEWNRWLVTVELAMIGVIGFILKTEERRPLHQHWIGWLVIIVALFAVLFLAISIILAAQLILSLPFFVEGRQARQGKPVILMVHRTIKGGRTRGRKVVALLKGQHALFVCGVVAFGVFIGLLLFLPSGEPTPNKSQQPNEAAATNSK